LVPQDLGPGIVPAGWVGGVTDGLTIKTTVSRRVYIFLAM